MSVAIIIAAKLFMEGLYAERLIASIIVSIPFTYWWVIPFLNGEDMQMPSWGFSLEARKNKFLRFVFFTFGASIYLICVFV